MSQQLINRNPDLQRLQSEGLALEIRDGQIYVHHVPYLNSMQEVCDGTLAFTFSAHGDILNPPSDHTAHWIGETPYSLNGAEVPSLVNSVQNGWNGHDKTLYLSLYPDSLPNRRYPDTYTKVSAYYKTISGHAWAKDKISAAKIKNSVTVCSEDGVFEYQDTNSARAGIVGLTNRLKGKKVAIIGLGGSGSYLLDFLAKTPVEEIHLFDDDVFFTHNAFRAPGAPSLQELESGEYKVKYFAAKYSVMHRHIISHNEKINEENISSLFGMDMVFMCVDSVKVRNFISRHLMEHNIPFIDSGLGLMMRKDSLAGQVRVTSFDGLHDGHIYTSFGKEDVDDEMYATNIQVAELNCMAALLMFIRWKRHLGFYASDKGLSLEDNYNIGMNKILSEYEDAVSDSSIC